MEYGTIGIQTRNGKYFAFLGRARRAVVPWPENPAGRREGRAGK
jgi:hypothetical protein